jgi:hypothetical protein
LLYLAKARAAFHDEAAVIFFGYDSSPRLPKIFLRTLLYSTSARGQVVEAMYVKLCQNGSERTFRFWGYGETNKRSPGSGLFVGQTGKRSTIILFFLVDGQRVR